jgi:uncharacterized sulfatase
MTRCLLCLLLFAVAGPELPAADVPNILYIISDDQAWTDYGFMGHDAIKTPHLDKLASQSATFSRGYVPNSLCRPSLATLITGLYPHQHKISGNDPVFDAPRGTPRYKSPDYLRLNAKLISHIEEVPTLPRLLGKKGYVSFQSGKWWEGNSARGGFTAGMTHGDVERGGRHGDAGLDIGRKGVKPVLDFIDAAGDKPWFVWYAPMLPHSPHNPPQRLLEKYTAPGKSEHVAKYQAMCEWFDETCGEILKHLDEKRLAENTLVVYVTDNGWIQNPEAPRYAPKSKRSPYDGGIRTPILLRWPGRIEPARYDDTLVSSIDLAPTILAAAGIPATDNMQGLNLLEVCRNNGRTDRARLFGEIFDHDVANVDVPAESLQYRWGIEGDWKLILPAREDLPADTNDGADPKVTQKVVVELYNLAQDPFEAKNLAQKHPEVVARLTRAIDEWWPGR